MTTLNSTSPSTTTAVAHCAMAKLAPQTISSMRFIGLDNWPRATTQTLGGGSVGSSLGPYSASSCAALSVDRPRSGLTPSCAAASSAESVYQATAWSGGLVVVIAAPWAWAGWRGQD